MPSFRQILKQSWDTFFANMWLFLGLELLAIFALSMSATLPLIGWVFSGVFFLGILKLADRIIKKQNIEFIDLFWYTRDLQTLMAAVIVVFAYQIFFILAVIAFILPGIWFSVAASYYLFVFTFDEKKQKGIEAIKSSLELLKGRWWEQFTFILFLSLVNLAGVLFFGVGILVSIPVSLLCLYHMFHFLYFPSPTGEPQSDMNLSTSVVGTIQVRPES